jgi:hypothetical protein
VIDDTAFVIDVLIALVLFSFLVTGYLVRRDGVLTARVELLTLRFEREQKLTRLLLKRTRPFAHHDLDRDDPNVFDDDEEGFKKDLDRVVDEYGDVFKRLAE